MDKIMVKKRQHKTKLIGVAGVWEKGEEVYNTAVCHLQGHGVMVNDELHFSWHNIKGNQFTLVKWHL